jgi:uncharacterized membrane protein YphA (DoxX/SURF4 family)
MKINEEIYGLDNRSILLFRFLLGFLLFYNLIEQKFRYFQYYSVEHGPFSNQEVSVIKGDFQSLMFIDTDVKLYILFIISGISYLLFAFSIMPLISNILSLLFYYIIAKRFFPYYDGHDTYIITVLFFSIFISSLYKQKQSNSFEIRSEYCYLFLFQIAIIYFFNGISKVGNYWQTGQAILMCISNPLINTKNYHYILFNDTILKILNYLTLIFEIILPFLLFIPYKSRYIRFVLVICLLVFHWGIDLFVDVGLYKYIASCCAIILIPDFVWDKLKLDFSKINFQLKKISIPFSLSGKISKLSKIISIIFFLVISFRATSFYLYKLNTKYNFIENQIIIELLRTNLTPVSPFKQSWSMFAPNPASTFVMFSIELESNTGKRYYKTDLNPLLVKNNHKSFKIIIR